jgi:hypothetical protein
LAELIGEPEEEEIPDQVGNDEKEPEPEPVVEPEPAPVAEPEPVVEPEPVKEEIPGQAGNDEKVEVPEQVVNEGKKRSWKWLKVVLIVLGALVALLLLFVILSRIAPGLLDPLLYSKEELQVLRY